MFSDEILEMIFARSEVQKVPQKYQSIMVHAVEEVMEEIENEPELSVHESVQF